jgi:hypothetical protein
MPHQNWQRARIDRDLIFSVAVIAVESLARAGRIGQNAAAESERSLVLNY